MLKNKFSKAGMFLLTVVIISVMFTLYAAAQIQIDKVGFRFDNPAAVNEVSDSSANTLYIAYDSAHNAMRCNVPEKPVKKAHDNQIIIKDKALELIDYPYIAVIYQVPEYDIYGKKINCYSSDMYVNINQGKTDHPQSAGNLTTKFDESDNSIKIGWFKWNDPQNDTSANKGKVSSIRMDFPNGVYHTENAELYIYEVSFFKSESDINAYFESVKSTLSTGGTTAYDNWSFEFGATDEQGTVYTAEKGTQSITAGGKTYTQKTFTITVPSTVKPEDLYLGWVFTKDSDYTVNVTEQVYINGYSRDLRGASGSDYNSFLTNGSRLGDAVKLTEAAAKNLNDTVPDYVKTDYADYRFNCNEFDLTLYAREYVHEVYKVKIIQKNVPTYEHVLKNSKYTINGGAWSSDYSSYGADHLQGITCDDEGRYMYMSFTNLLVKIDMHTNRVVGTVKGLKPGSLTQGAHLGCLAYHDGKVYGSLGYTKEKQWYIAVFDCDKINGEVNYTDEGVMYALYLPQARRDILNTLEAGEATFATTSMGHRYGASSIDGITFGTLPGKGYDSDGDGDTDIPDNSTYMFVSFGPYGNAKRYDNENMVLMVFDTKDITENNLLPFNETRLITDTEEQGYFYKHKLFCYTGNQTYGIQCLEFDKDTGDIWMECYPRPEGTEFPSGNRYVIDGSVPLFMDEVEVGQSVTADSDGFITKSAAHATADVYTDYEDGDGDGNTGEREQGWHMSLKCICSNGSMSRHNSKIYGATGHECKICMGNNPFDVGMISLGNDYFYGARSVSETIDSVEYEYGFAYLYRLDRSGEYKFEKVADTPAPVTLPNGGKMISYRLDSVDAVKQLNTSESAKNIYIAYDSAENALRVKVPEFPTQKASWGSYHDNQLIIEDKSLEMIDYPYFAVMYRVPQYDKYGNAVSRTYNKSMQVYFNQNVSGYTLKSGVLNTTLDAADNSIKMGWLKWNDPDTDTDPVPGKIFKIRLDIPNGVRPGENAEYFIYEIAFFQNENDISTYFDSVKANITHNGSKDFDNWDFELKATDGNGAALNVENGNITNNGCTQKTFTITLPFGTKPEDIKLGWTFKNDADYPYISQTQVYLNGYSRDLRGAKGSDHTSFLTNGVRLGDAVALTEAAAKALYQYDPNGQYGFTTKERYKDYAFNYSEFDITVYNREYVYEVYKIKTVCESPLAYEGAQIRSAGTQGLRFLFSIPTDYFDTLTKPQSSADTGEGFGSIVIPQSILESSLTKDTNNAAVVPAVNIFERTPSKVYYTVCITSIPSDKYKEKFVFIPYATSHGTTLYGQCDTPLSVYDVAVQIYNSSQASAQLKEYVYEHIIVPADSE
ncbi:MAG: hypothetical protein E7588_05905 [Ruminococcaceae bacterium]|nr:hypothetical protein [Oscillospiraceae bacterium]